MCSFGFMVRLICYRTDIHDSDPQTSPSSARKIPQGVTLGRRRYKRQVLDYTAGNQDHVCRGVWSSELRNQCDMVEMASIIAGFTLEADHGPPTGEAMVRAMVKGRVPMSIVALTDSYSNFSYLAAQHLKLPAEMGTY